MKCEIHEENELQILQLYMDIALIVGVSLK